jgi:superfamily I DNA and/or RNA helicase
MIWKASGTDSHPGALARVKSVTSRSPETKNMTLNVYLPGFSFIRSNVWSAKKITSLTPSLREYEAMVKLGEYSLGYQILNPTKISVPQVDKSRTSKIMSAFKVNGPQAEAIIAATTQNRGFIMIQGPPGTGKTKTILGIIGASIKKSRAIPTPGSVNESLPLNHNRILCCAPSNAAVDEICRRLLSGIFDIYGKTFFPNIIRFGKASVHPSVQSVTLVI